MRNLIDLINEDAHLLKKPSKGFSSKIKYTKQQWEEWLDTFDADDVIVVNLVDQPNLSIVIFDDEEGFYGHGTHFATYDSKTETLSTNQPDLFEE
jgi:hypothetical protein